MKLSSYLENPSGIIQSLGTRGLLNWMPDEQYIKMIYRLRMGRKLDLADPKGFNEKLQWLKLHDRKPAYAVMADKFGVRDYIAKTIGKEYLVPLLGVWDSAEDICFHDLPRQFVLKCTHDSGSIVICKDKSTFDFEGAKKHLKKSLKKTSFGYGREWPYKNIRPRILCEQYLLDESHTELKDYKVHCFNGLPKIILVCSNRFQSGGLKEDFFDTNWHHLDMRRPKHPNSGLEIKQPENLPQMLALSEILAKGHPFVRIDFYESGRRLYFGELTFYPLSGFAGFLPASCDELLGSWIELPV
ncbi:MAG: ATP-grasp fold amidoligase family protein [Christensenellales bacterium]